MESKCFMQMSRHNVSLKQGQGHQCQTLGVKLDNPVKVVRKSQESPENVPAKSRQVLTKSPQSPDKVLIKYRQSPYKVPQARSPNNPQDYSIMLDHHLGSTKIT